MITETQKTFPLLAIAGGYALLLSGAILLGLPGAFGEQPGYPGNAVQMPVAATLIALVCGGSGIGLLKRQNWARFVFLAVVPWGSLALGSVFANSLWQNDIPYTVLAIFIYIPTVFLLGREGTLQSLGVAGVNWLSRGGGVALAFVVLMVVARLVLAASKPSGGASLLDTLDSLNTYVQYLVLCEVPMWNYIGALVALSIPTRLKWRSTA